MIDIIHLDLCKNCREPKSKHNYPWLDKEYPGIFVPLCHNHQLDTQLDRGYNVYEPMNNLELTEYYATKSS